VRAEPRIRSVDTRFRILHPVLVKKGLPPDLWADFRSDLDTAPQISWAKFAATEENSPRKWATHIVVTSGIFGLFLLYGFSKNPESRLTPGMIFGSFAFTGSFFLYFLMFTYSYNWIGRTFDEECLNLILSKYGPRFLEHDVRLVHTAGAPRVEVDASFSDEDMRRMQEEEVLLREEERREWEENRRRRRAERDAYYLDRGIKPGPMAWYHALSDWCQATLLGLGIGLMIALTGTVAWLLVRR